MPMHGTHIRDASGKVIGIACSRGPAAKSKPCTNCGQPGKLLCDGKGCDKPLCAACAVGHTKNVDYCPACFTPAWRRWKSEAGGLDVYQQMGRAVARARFRQFARERPHDFIAMLNGQALCTAAQPCAICAGGGESCR